jgi:glycosyltransferase involved in cell wall biosynthesis
MIVENGVNKKKILLICPFARPNLGGVESHIDKLMDYMVKKGFLVTLVTYQPLSGKVRGLPYEKGAGYEIIRTDWFGDGWFNKLEKYFPLVFVYLFPGLLIKSLVYYLKEHKSIDCIHAHGFVSAVIARVLQWFHTKRIVVSTHAIYDLKNRTLLRFMIRNLLIGFDKVLAVSEVSKNELISIGIPAERVEVHKNWIDTQLFSPREKESAKSQLGIKEEFNVLFVGRLIEKKGILLFIEAAKRIPSVGFHIVGNGPLEETVRQAVMGANNIHYYGILRQSDLAEKEKLIALYNVCDLTISPYTYDEGFSTILIESLSCGTPLIVTKRGSPPTFLSEEVTAYLSSEPSVEELVKVLLEVLEGKVLPSVPVCRDFAEKNFGFANADTILNSYEPRP